MFMNYPGLIKHIDFRNESETRRDGGVPTDVVFENGKAVFNGTSSKVNYDLGLNGTYSVRIRCNPTNFAVARYLLDTRGTDNNGIGTVYINVTTGIISGSSGTDYVNGIQTSTANAAVNNEIVITGISLVQGTGSNKTLLCSQRSNAIEFLGTIDLFEIYNRTLSAEEVANFYNDSWNKEQNFGGGLNSPLSFTNDFTVDWIIALGAYITDATHWGSSGSGGVRITSKLTINSKYKCRIAGTSSASSFDVRQFGTIVIYKNGLSGTFDEEFTFTAVDEGLYLRCIDSQDINITAFEIREINPLTLLDFNSTNGVLELGDLNETSTITDVDVVKDGKWGAKFNGTTSKIDTGTDMIGTKAVTVMGWIKPYSLGEINIGSIITNGGLYFRLRSNYTIAISSNGETTTVNSSTDSILLNKLQFIAVTRTTDGTVNFYIGDKDTPPTLSGIPNQNSGTPVAGTTNAIIGNNSTQDRTFDGLIPDLEGIEGVLPLIEITRGWSSTVNYIKG